MLKPDDLRAMTPEDRTATFNRLADAFYGGARTAQIIADDMGVSRTTVFNWMRENNVPFPVIFTYDRWMHSEAKAAQIMADWADLPAQLSEAAEAMAKVAQTVARVARFSAARTPDAP